MSSQDSVLLKDSADLVDQKPEMNDRMSNKGNPQYVGDVHDISHDHPVTTPNKPTRVPLLPRNLSEMSIECNSRPDQQRQQLQIIDDNDDTAEDKKTKEPYQGLIEAKVKDVFELPHDEVLVDEFPCYLIRLVTLPGWMYLTTNYICFYASLPGKRKGPYKAGYLSKKNHITSPRTYRYYFELRNHILSWYSSAENKYSPLNSIDLKIVTKVEPSKLRKYGIRLSTTHHHYTIIADSELSQKEWMDELQKGVFVAQHEGNSVRIVLPFNKITLVDKPKVFQFAANIKIRFGEDGPQNNGEDYYFAFFPDTEKAYNSIVETWKSTPRLNQVKVTVGSDAKEGQSYANNPMSRNSSSSYSTFLGLDPSFSDNITPAALPTMLMGKLMNVTSVFQNNQTRQGDTTTGGSNVPSPGVPVPVIFKSEEEEAAEEEFDESIVDGHHSENVLRNNLESQQQQSSNSLLSPIKALSMNSDSQENGTSLRAKLKRNSLLFIDKLTSNEQSSENQQITTDNKPPVSPNLHVTAHANVAPTYSIEEIALEEEQKPAQATNKSRPSSGSFSKIPRAFESIKNQVRRPESNSATSTTTTSSTSTSPSSDTDSLQVPSTDTLPTGRHRSSSIGSSIRHHISPTYLYNKFSNIHAPHITSTAAILSTQTALPKEVIQQPPGIDTSLPVSDFSTSSSHVLSETTQSNLSNPSTSPISAIISPTSTQATRSSRATSISRRFSSGKAWSRLSISTHYSSESNVGHQGHKQPKGPIWLSTKTMKELETMFLPENDESESEESEEHERTMPDINRSLDEEEKVEDLLVNQHLKDVKVVDEEQEVVNEHLNINFPMLLKTETVEAVFKASFWKTIPYSGKLYITDKYFCFHSRILAGQQKLIVPWKDVIQVDKIKSRSYYMLYGISMVVKNMTDQVYLDFSSVELRDTCFLVCQHKYDSNTLIFDESSIISRNSSSVGLSLGSEIILDRPEHITPPIEYNGPPLLTSSSSFKFARKLSIEGKSLHFTCLTIGSRGDVQPYLALCKELQKDGHRCRIATHPEYEQWITQHGIEFKSVGGDPAELMKLCIDNSFLSVSFIREGTRFFYSWFESLLLSAYEACKGTDVLIESPSAMVGVHMAEKLAIPYFRCMPFPFTRTAKFPHPFAIQSSAGGRIYNDMTYVMIDMALWTGTSKYVNRFRQNVLKLPATSLDRLELWKVPYLYSFSPTVVHPPKDWPDYIHCTGYWFLDNPDQSWKQPASLIEFLVPNDKPIVYIGFGSIIVPDAAEVTKVIVEAVLESNVRAIICKGWSTRSTESNKNKQQKADKNNNATLEGLEDLEDDSTALLSQYPELIYSVDSVPHDWLFPQIQGVVHHGGAGTTAAGLRAGLPTVIRPFFGDQRFWGHRVEQLQVGLCINKLSKSSLAGALTTITQNKAMIAKAKAIGATIRKENGPRNAINSIYREFEFAREQRVQHAHADLAVSINNDSDEEA